MRIANTYELTARNDPSDVFLTKGKCTSIIEFNVWREVVF